MPPLNIMETIYDPEHKKIKAVEEGSESKHATLFHF